MVSRSTPAIVLGPTGNMQGTYNVFNLCTGKKIKRRKLTVMPMPDSVIAQVERLGQKNATPNMFDFSDRNGVLFEWNDDVDERLRAVAAVEGGAHLSNPSRDEGHPVCRDHRAGPAPRARLPAPAPTRSQLATTKTQNSIRAMLK